MTVPEVAASLGATVRRGSGTPRRPRILFVDNDAGTFLLHRLALARAAAAAGFEVHVGTPPSVRMAELEREGFSVHSIPMSRRRLSLLADWKTFTAIRGVYRVVRPDVIHNLRLKPVLYGGLAARLDGHPAVVSMLTGLGTAFTMTGVVGAALRKAVSLGLRFVFGHPNQCVTVESASDRAALDAAGTLERRRCVVVSGSGVDTDVYRPGLARDVRPLVVFASRLLWNKGVGQFVAAARLLAERGSPARCVLVGAPDPENPASVPEEALEEWVRSGVVEWWQWRSDMPSILQQSSVVCLPTTYGEGIPRILIEAASCGVPLVTTGIGGCREIARDGETALVAAPDGEAVAAAIARLLEDEGLRARLGARGRMLVLQEFSIDRVLDQIFEIYAQLLPEFALAGRMRRTFYDA